MTGGDELSRPTNRRRFLKRLGAVSALGVAGCGGDGDTGSPGGTTEGSGGTTGAPAESSATTGGSPETTRTTGTTPTDSSPRSGGPPNIVFVMADDMGYGDTSVEPFVGEETYSTPNLEEMAANGARFTSHYCDAPRCTPTRAALMTGSYPPRTGVTEVRNVITYEDEIGLNPTDTTVADSLGQQGYTTACIGKWHLGTDDPFLPPNQGFDYFYGAPHSNDMEPFYLQEGLEVVDGSPKNRTLTERYTEKATTFIEDNAADPFFLYLPHSMSHVPLGVSEEFEGVADTKYGDVMRELDWSVGRILDTLEELGLTENTLVMFTTDDGTWRQILDAGAVDVPEGHVGNEEPLRGSKNTENAYEGGFRVPMIAQWPGTIPAGTRCDEITAHIDMLPTFAEIAGGAPLPEYNIDGRSIAKLLRNPESASTPHEYYYYCAGPFADEVRAIRNAEGYKYVVTGGELYDLRDDLGEENDVSGQRSDLVEELSARATAFEERLNADAREPGDLAEIAYLTISADGGATVTVINNFDVIAVPRDLTVRAPHEDWTVETDFFQRGVASGSPLDVELTAPNGDLTEEVYLEASTTFEVDETEIPMKAGETINGGPDVSGGVVLETPRPTPSG